MSVELELQNNLVKWGKLEPWKMELAELVIKAHNENKLLRCYYNGRVFEPIALMKCLINGRFVWGVVNWELVKRERNYADKTG